ncbi:MAG: CDP-alcohol phosphatidyltransferase family protein [Atopobiaceae bacterium]|nr:CDP-alcohol phosphatidyltransferase family protein [Atopobiaceae bacterium]
MAGKGERGLANALTICRILLSLALLVLAALSPAFFVLYALAGVTDMFDGYVARRTGTETELGARLDSVADLVLVIVCMVKILPAIDVPTWLWIWVAAIALVKVVNAASGLKVERHLVMPHTTTNKVAGLVVFLVPFAIPLVGVTVPAIIACAIATFAAVQEGHFIRTGRA